MSRLIILLLLFGWNTQCLVAQETNSKEFVIALAKIQNIESTGKRHNSYFFSFKIEKVLEGKINDSIIKTQEIYWDFGGSQIFSKIYPDKKNFIQKDKNKPEDVIVKFYYLPDSDKISQVAQLKWVAESHRRKSLDRLEKLIDSYYSNKSNIMDYNVLLQEHNGKLFFSCDVVSKVAVETRSGSWIIATIDKTD